MAAFYLNANGIAVELFQSLKGFQRFCGDKLSRIKSAQEDVSIPKRVSEVLWLAIASLTD